MSEPSDKLTIQGKTYKMSYGLLIDLQRMIPNAEQAVTYISTDSFVRDYLVRRVLTEKKGSVTDENELIKSEDVDLSMNETLEVLNWVTEHLLYFFTQQALALGRSAKHLQSLTDPSLLPPAGSTA